MAVEVYGGSNPPTAFPGVSMEKSIIDLAAEKLKDYKCDGQMTLTDYIKKQGKGKEQKENSGNKREKGK
jgi:hypothetical protein